MGWQSKKNGELLKLMLQENFEVLFTFDKNLQYQQNFASYPIAVFVLNVADNAYKTLIPIVPIIHRHLKKKLMPSATEIKL